MARNLLMQGLFILGLFGVLYMVVQKVEYSQVHNTNLLTPNQDNLKQKEEDLKHDIKDAAGHIHEKYVDVKEKVKETAKDVGEKVQETAENIKEESRGFF